MRSHRKEKRRWGT